MKVQFPNVHLSYDGIVGGISEQATKRYNRCQDGKVKEDHGREALYAQGVSEVRSEERYFALDICYEPAK